MNGSNSDALPAMDPSTAANTGSESGPTMGKETVGNGQSVATEQTASAVKDSAEEGTGRWIVRARGLPWSAGESDVRKFFGSIDIKELHFVYNFQGRPSGEVYVELENETDCNHALALDRESLMNRYIEINQATKTELDWVLSHQKKDSSEGSMVRIRGIPFNCSKEDIAQFFEGLEMAEDGILMPVELGKPSGEAFVRFVNKETAEKALDRNMQNIGQRYIEVFRATSEEWERAAAVPKMLGMWDGKRPKSLLEIDLPPPPPIFPRRPGPLFWRGRGRFGFRGPPGMWGRFRPPFWEMGPWAHHGGWHDSEGDEWDEGFEDEFPQAKRGKWEGDEINPCYVYMKGLPFDATATDVIAFFAPLKVLNVDIEYGRNKKAMGGCRVEFSDEDEALKALAKDKEMMQHRYIDLFHAEPPPADKKTAKRQQRELERSLPAEAGAKGQDEISSKLPPLIEPAGGMKANKDRQQKGRGGFFTGGSKGWVQGPSLQADMQKQNPWMASRGYEETVQYPGFAQNTSGSSSWGRSSSQNSIYQQPSQQQAYDAYQQYQNNWANTQPQSQEQYQEAWQQYWQAWSQWQQQSMSWPQYQPSTGSSSGSNYTPSYAQPTGQVGTYSAVGRFEPEAPRGPASWAFK